MGRLIPDRTVSIVPHERVTSIFSNDRSSLYFQMK